ncbi:MAG: FHA domain-containing protein [Clostridiales bacterium]|nr:FHA domain-containing protein [Clostridiales bacterium]
MNRLVENKVVEELSCRPNFAFVLSDAVTFLPTEYKVFRSQENCCFVRCAKLLYNGKTELYYLPDGYRSFADLIPSMDGAEFLSASAGILYAAAQVEANGFLSCRNIDISFEKIFINVNTRQARLTYLPVQEGVFPDDVSFESELKSSLYELARSRPEWGVPDVTNFMNELTYGSLNIGDLARHSPGTENLSEKETKMQLISSDAANRVVLDINKDEYVIGRKPSAADGVITFNNVISRVHCRILKKDGKYFIEDLRSSNGTYVNHVPLLPGQRAVVKDGDNVRLANSDFKAVIRQVG